MSNIQPYIILNGTDSRSISGLLISSLPPISKPQVRTQIETVDGRDGDIVTPLGFSAYDKVIKIGLTYNYDIDEIIEYFNSEGIVTFSNEPDKYYRYSIYEQIDFEKLIRFKTAEVTLHVQPFKFSTTEEPELFDVVSGQAIAVTNEGNTDSRPNLTIIGSGDIDVSLNGSQILSIELEGDQAVIIDSEDMNAYAAQSAIREVVADIEPEFDTNGYGSVWIGGAGKNKLENTSTVTSLNSIAYTKNEDGSVKLTGTASAAINATYINYFTLPSGTYIFTDNTTSSNCYLYLLIEGSSVWYRNGDTFTVDGNTRTRVVTFVTNGAATNLTLYPMIRLASVADSDFEPYENIGEISGYTSANVNLCGKNLLNIDNFVQRSGYSNLSVSYANKDITISGYNAGGRFACFNVFTDIGKTYTVKYSGRTNISDCRITNSDTKPTAWISGGTTIAVNTAYTFTSVKSWYQIWIELSADNAVISELQIELGAQATDFEDYSGETYNIPFEQTVYGGSLNLTTGELIIDMAFSVLDETTTFYQSGNSAYINLEGCSIVDEYGDAITNKYNFGTWSQVTGSDATKFTLYKNSAWTVPRLAFNLGSQTLDQFVASLENKPIQVLYKLAEPIVVQLTPTQIYNLLGVNNMYSDIGDITVKHKANGVIVTDTGAVVSFYAGLDDIEKGVLLNRAITGDYDKIRLRKGVNTFVLTGNARQFVIDKFSRWI